MYHDIVLLNFEANGPEGNNRLISLVFSEFPKIASRLDNYLFIT